MSDDFTRDLEPPRRALAIGAHSDDVEFGCGATLAKWSAAGTAVDLLVLTDGSKGTWDPKADLAALVTERQAEQRAAAEELGIADVTFLKSVDGELSSGLDQRAAVCEVIRRVRPDVLLGHDPWKRYRLHPDHLHAGRLTIDGIVAARDPHFFPERGEPHRPERLLLFEAEVIDHVETLSDADVQAKVKALLRHRTQWLSTMHLDPDEPDLEGFAAGLLRDAAEAGALVGAPLGEAFKLMSEL
jgi:LmbE family N-acetylglucosaminyl deacetylase